MVGINLAHGDAIELTELLQFIDTWLANDHDQLNPSLHRFVGTPSYDISKLRTTLARFVFLLGGDNEGDLFQPRQPPHSPKT